MEKYYLISKAIRELIFTESTAVFLKEKIATRYSLSLNQSVMLSRTIRDVLVADFYFGDFVIKLTERLGIDGEKGKEIAAILIGELFSPVLEDIKKVHKEKFKRDMIELPKEAAPVVPAPPTQPASSALPIANPNNVLDLRKKDGS